MSIPAQSDEREREAAQAAPAPTPRAYWNTTVNTTNYFTTATTPAGIPRESIYAAIDRAESQRRRRELEDQLREYDRRWNESIRRMYPLPKQSIPTHRTEW